MHRIGFDSASHCRFCHFLNVDDEYPHIVEQALRKVKAYVDARPKLLRSSPSTPETSGS